MILTALIFLPIIGLLFILFIPKEKTVAIRSIAVGISFVTLIISVIILGHFDRNASGLQFAEKLQWFDFHIVTIHYEIGIDGLSLPLIVLTTIVSFLACIASFSIRYRVKEFYIWLLILLTGMLGVFASIDMFLFFLFYELTLFPMFFIIGIWGGKERNYAAYKFLIYTGLGSAFMFIIFIVMFYLGAKATGFQELTFSMKGMAELFANAGNSVLTNNVRGILFLALLIAFAIKLPVFPFHTWLPNAHVEAPTAASMILAGVLLKMGGYGLIRIGVGILPDQAERFAGLLAVLGVVNIIYGALIALVQSDLKRLVAYSSISHMGIVLLGISSFTASGLQGAIFQLVSHGFISALLFFMVGAIYERTHTRTISELGGLAKSVPILAGFTLAAAMASLGLPGLSGFVSELLTLIGVFGADPALLPGAKVFGVIAGFGIIFTAAYLLWAIQRTTFGPAKEKYRWIEDARPLEYIPMVGLFAFSLLIGVYPKILSDVVNLTVFDILSRIGG